VTARDLASSREERRGRLTRVASLRITAELAWTLVLAGAAAAVVWPRLLLIGPTDDDGLMAGNALRFAAGDTPYRDYFSALTPGADVLYGLWFRAVGSSYLTYRLLTALVLLAGAVLLFRLARCVLPPAWAAGSALLWVAWCSMFFRIGPYHFAGTVLILGMTLAVVAAVSRPDAVRLGVVAGVCGSAAVVFAQSFAPAAVAGLVAALLVVPGPRRIAVAMLAGAGVVAVALLGWLALTGALDDCIRDCVGFVLSSYVPSHRLSLPWWPQRLHSFPLEPWAYLGSAVHRLLKVGFWVVAFGAQALVLGLALVAILRRGRVNVRREVVVLAVVSSGLFVPVLTFAWSPHSWLNAALAVPLVGVALAAASSRLGRSGRRVAVVGLALAVAAAAAVPPALGVLVRTDVRAGDEYVAVHASGTTVSVHTRSAPAAQRMIDFARAHPADRIAFLPLLPAMYLLTHRPPPVSHVLLVPGYNTDAQLDDVADELVAGDVRWVFYAGLSQATLQTNLPPAAARARGTWRFERLLAERYVARQRFGEIVPLGTVMLYERRPS
jgi:hypothetical protein